MCGDVVAYFFFLIKGCIHRNCILEFELLVHMSIIDLDIPSNVINWSPQMRPILNTEFRIIKE